MSNKTYQVISCGWLLWVSTSFLTISKSNYGRVPEGTPDIVEIDITPGLVFEMAYTLPGFIVESLPKLPKDQIYNPSRLSEKSLAFEYIFCSGFLLISLSSIVGSCLLIRDLHKAMKTW
jgi:hypothetical protein